ncbi:protein kinase C-binding protein 1-like isoform X2 [Lytechinus variegatus]|uniref:protein kinase C-binding protein 1-like isoform X2 n=1 Tax=Lytechinus variegatus TaxID=7654 RepID=UPI001BB29742|nr:protein kinase C-binding protein 1-like isoform X2 [Lytechinus variegatus]
MDFSDAGQIVPIALRRTHRANAGAKRKAAEEETVKEKDKRREMKKKKKKKLPASLNTAANSTQSVTKLAADFMRSKHKVPVPKVIKNLHPHNDFYCWICHNQRYDGKFLYCNVCPRAYHDTCANVPCPQPDWVCLECENITDAECTETQSNAMASLSLDKLAKVLRTAIGKMKRYTNSLLFTPIDDLREFRDYRQFIFHPMDLSLMEKNVQSRSYGSTESFLADAKWIVHNAFVYFGGGNRYSNAAKSFLKACETEMAEVELCPDCYLGAVCKQPQWFSEVCTKPHPLIWAKLHGFPFWPAKAMKEEDGLIEARFFGQHDRAMIPAHNCFQYSTKIPFPASKKRLTGLNAAIKEAEVHIKKLEEKQGHPFKYAPHLTPYDPNKRYTTSSLAVMPDGKVKCLTDAGKNAESKAKAVENGEEASKKEKEEETDDKMDISLASSVEDDKTDGKADALTEMKTDSSPGSSLDGSELDVTGDSSQSPYHVDLEHSYASREFLTMQNEEGKADQETEKGFQKKHIDDSNENVTQSRVKEDEGEHSDTAGKEYQNDDEGQSIDTDRKRKVSESPQQPEKMPRMSSDKDSNLSPGRTGQGTVEPDAEDPDKLKTCPRDVTKEEGTHTVETIDSPVSKKLVAKDDDKFSILPSRLPKLDDLESNVNSSEASSSIPKEEVKSNQSTPRKDTFLLNLSKTIDTCKASLGIDEDMEEELGDEGGRDEEDGLDDADMTGDETMESEVDDEEEETEKASFQAASPSNDTSTMDDATDEYAGENMTESKVNQMLKDSHKVLKEVVKTLEDGVDSPVISEKDSLAMETEDVGDSEEINSRGLRGDESNEKEKTNDQTLAESSKVIENDESQSDEKLKDMPAQAKSTQVMDDKASIDDDIEDDDDEDDVGEDVDDYDGDSSDGALLIDEGNDESGDQEKKEDATRKCNKPDDETKITRDTDITPANTNDQKEKKPEGIQPKVSQDISSSESTEPEAKQEEAKDKEAKQEEAKDKEAKDKESSQEAKKIPAVGDKKVAELSKSSKQLMDGTPKPVEMDPDYKMLIAKVVDDAVKSFKELDSSLEDASDEIKKLVLDLKREVISLKAKQELQEKEMMHCNNLAAAEIRQVMEYSKDCKLNKVKRKFDLQRKDAIFDTKGKQWCASCRQEANYFCCWNTSYCSYNCQERHWQKHEKKCQQKSGNFPFAPSAVVDPYDPCRKKKKKKKRVREEEQAWLKEYGFGGEESDNDDPTWEPDPEDYPTMVARKKTYTLPTSNTTSNPNALRKPNPGQYIPNRSWTQPSGNVASRQNVKMASMTSPMGTQQVNPASKIITQTPSKMYMPPVQQNGPQVIGQNASTGQVVINSHTKPVNFVPGPRNDVSKQPNVVYVGTSKPGIQMAYPTSNLTVQANPGISGGIQNQGTPNMPFKLQMGSNKLPMSSLVQALGQPVQQGSKFFIQVTPGQQGSNGKTVKVSQMPQQPIQAGNMPIILNNVIGGLPQGQIAPAAIVSENVLQNIQPVGGKKSVVTVPRLAPGSAPSPKQIVFTVPNATNTAVSSISAPSVAPVVVGSKPVEGNIPPGIKMQVTSTKNS